MAVKTPVRGEFNGSGDLTGLSEFQASDFIGISDGGTGAITAAGARTNLGLVIGTNIQAFDAQLTDVAGLAVTDGGFIVGDGSNFVLETGNTARASLGLGTSDSPTFNGLTLSGNLIINGTTTTINSTVVTVDDPIFTLGGDTAPGSDDNKDRGIEFRYHNGSTAKLGFFGFDDSTGKFTFIPDATNTSEVFSGTAGTIVANLEGNVTGTVSSISNLDTDNLSEGSSNLYFTNERVDDRVGALLIDSATSGIDISYDDASNQLTISTDLGEITADLNERVDDRVDSLLTAGSNVSLTYDDAAGTLTIASTDTNTQLTTEQVQDIVGGMVDGGTETNVTVTYDDTNGRLNFVVDQLTSEQVQDIIGPMFSSNTETFIDVAYDDSDGTLDLVVPVKDEDNMASDSDTHLATQQSIKAYVDSQVTAQDLDFQADSGGALSIDLDSETITFTGGTGIDTTGSSNDVSFAIDNTVSTLTGSQTLTNKTISGADNTLSNIGNSSLSNSSVSYGGVSLALGASDATPAFDLSDATNYPTSSLTGTITNAQLAGSIANAKLSNSTVSYGGVSLALGASDATPAFDLSDATNYPTSSLTGTITNAQLAGSIANAKLANSSITVTDGSNSTATALGGTITFSGTSNEVEVAESSGTITIGLPNDVTIAGDLTVSGTTTTVDSTTVTINDPLVRYADNNSGNSVDFGFYGKYVQSATTKYGGLVWDASQTDKFRLFHGNQAEPTTTVNVSGTGHTTGTLIANLEGNVTGNVTGNITGSSGSTTGNAATATALASAQNFSLTGDVTASAVSFDGSGAVALSTTITDNSVQIGNIDFLVDEDNMASDSAVKVPTQQSVKAYVDSQVTAQDLDFTADSGGALAIDLDSETLTFTGGTGIDTSGSGNAVTFAIDSTVVTESSTDTLTNKTLNLENNTVIVEYAVTAAGGKFVIDGQSQATISFRPGVVHRFDLSDNSVASHPFVLSETSEGTAYTTGRTASGTQGQAGAYIEFTVNAATPDILYYYCSSHSGMGGTITVFGSAYGDADVQSYLSAGTGITLSGSGVIATTITQYADSDVQSYLSAGTGITLSGSGVIASSITQYADSDVQSYLSGGTGVTMSGSGEFSIGQAVATTSNVTFADVAATGNVVITGNLDVNGTTTTIDTTNTTVTDSLIELGNGTSGSPSNDAGIVIERGSADNAFVGFDESADKFIVGTGSFTGASTGNLTISTGTLVANLEGNVTGNVTGNVSGSSGSTTGNAATATALATGRTIGMTGDVVWTSASFDGSGDVTGAATIQSNAVETGMVNANVISGQSAYSGSVDTTNDFVLIYDHSTTSLKKIAVSDLNAASGAGTMTSFTIAADSGSSQVVADSNTLTLTGGSGIDTSVGGTDTVTVALNTEAVQDIVGAMFSSNTETNITATYQDSDGTIDLVASAGTVTEAFKTIAVSGQSDVVADSGTDTLTFVAGSNITLTTDASGDSITIAAADTNTQLTQEQVEDFAANVVVAGANITKTYDDAAGTLTLAATGGAANAFSTIAVAGQSNVVADAATDTLTLAAGTGMTLTTTAGTDTITFASSGGGSGSMPLTLAGGSSDPIVLSQATSIGAIPFTSFSGSTDNIDLTGTSQTVTTFADNDGDTKLEVERSADNDTVFIKAGGTDVLTATSSGVTISNLTVTGTSTQANEMKITDTLIELNADATSLGVDAGLVIERGNTGADAAFIWDESSDSFAVGLLSSDRAVSFTKADGNAQDIPISSNEVAFNHANGSADNLPITANNLAFTEADGTSDPIASFAYGPDTDMNVKLVDATLKAKTQSQSDNSTKVATTAYVDTALGGVSSNSITDADGDTKIQVEEGSDEDIIRADTAGQERVTIDNNVSMSARGGFFTHNATMHASETFTIAATEGTVAAGPLDVQGTVDVQGTLVVV